MSVNYYCRHCNSLIGSVHEVEEWRLGFHFLTPEERNDIISYNSNGDVMVRVICDYCKEALDSNPELTLVANPLQ
jgi:hypothetical protein